MEQLQDAIIQNEIIQKKKKKETYTKPDLFFRIESFIKEKRLIGYGGTAINNALPKEERFYQVSDIPDYDFFSTHATEHIRELADMVAKRYPNVEVKPAIFPGTYKLFVNYLPLVDITQIDDALFHDLFIESFVREGIHYVPYNYLRMSMYQELARPMGDLTRWPKVFKRLTLLNKHHPFLIRKCDVKPKEKFPVKISKDIAKRIKDYVCLGDHTMYYWQDLFPVKYTYEQQDTQIILSDTIEEIWDLLKGLEIKYTFYENKLIKVYEIYIDTYPILYVILSDSCMNYNFYKSHKIASYDTIMSLYYALSFVHVKHLSKKRLLSYCYLLHQIKENEDHPLMKRFQMPCYGTQITMEELRRKRESLYKKNKHSRYFFHYRPKYTHRRTKIDLSRKKRSTIKNGH
jgi:hypothetical protein